MIRITKTGIYFIARGPAYLRTKFQVIRYNAWFLTIFQISDPELHKLCDKIRNPNQIRLIFHVLRDIDPDHEPTKYQNATSIFKEDTAKNMS